MAPPVVVQGTAVARPPEPVTHGGGTGTNVEHQPSKTGCNDPIFALLLYGNVAAIVAVAVVYGPASFDGSSIYVYNGYVYAAVATAVVSVFVSGFGLLLNMQYPETIIKIALIFVVVLSGVWAVMAFIAGEIFAGVLGAVFFLCGVCYARAVWSRIPFAAVNMLTAATAIKANLGVTIFAYFFTALEVGWVVLWSIALAGVFNQTYTCTGENCNPSPSYGILFLLFLAFYFTQQVLQVRVLSSAVLRMCNVVCL